MADRNRQMVFIDGTNFLVQLSKYLGLEFRAEKLPWSTIDLMGSFLHQIHANYPKEVIRRYWFASYKGDEKYFNKYRSELRRRNFEPRLFRKRDEREKGVDIALTKEMLVNAFRQNCDEVFLIAGDEDYVELVEEVKRYGQKICGAFFQDGLSENLRLSLDVFYCIDNIGFGVDLTSFKTKIEKEVGSPTAD